MANLITHFLEFTCQNLSCKTSNPTISDFCHVNSCKVTYFYGIHLSSTYEYLGIEFIYSSYQSSGIQIGDGTGPAISTEITTKVVVPTTIDSQPVIRIAPYAFERCNFTEIELPDTIESLGNSSFQLCKISHFTAPTSLKTMEIYSFNASSIVTVDLSTCSAELFGGSFLFSECLSLIYVKLPQTLTVIPNWCFRQTLLENITITKNVKEIKDAAFIDCLNLNVFISESPYFVVFNGIVYSPDFKILYCYPSNGTLEILPTVRSIQSCKAFSGCSFKNFTLKIPITYVYRHLFRKCTQVEVIDLTCGVFTTLYYSDFGWCDNLKEVRLPNTVSVFDGKIFPNSLQLKTLVIPSSLVKGGTGFDESFFTDLYFCGVGPVSGQMSYAKIHVTNQYQGNKFMGISINDKTASCEMTRCPEKYSDIFICTIPVHNAYYLIHITLLTPFILI